jgi:pSer/pThr/pTyr-binding forkhead associated (FHA) protein
MPVTLVLRSATPNSAVPNAPLTFDGARVVLGRGSGCDVRLPDPSVTLRHASIRATHGGYALVDEGSTNGTFVGDERLSPHTPRPLRHGEVLRLGRIQLEVRLDHVPPTDDVSLATRDLALALVTESLRSVQAELRPFVVVVKGPEAGRQLVLAEEGHVYIIGRQAPADLALRDEDVSRDHAGVVRQGVQVTIMDRRSKNGLHRSGGRVGPGEELPWRPGTSMQMGGTLLLLVEPIADALLRLESGEDEVLESSSMDPVPPALPAATPLDVSTETSPANGGDKARPKPGTASKKVPTKRRGAVTFNRWKLADVAIMAVASVVFAASLAGLFWLLKS